MTKRISSLAWSQEQSAESCRAKMLQFGVGDKKISAIEAILERTRSFAIGHGRIENPRSAFIVMKYTADDENDKAYRHG